MPTVMARWRDFVGKSDGIPDLWISVKGSSNQKVLNGFLPPKNMRMNEDD
jgi:hypothetical protein